MDRARLVPKPIVVCVDDDRRVLGALSRLLRHEAYDLRLTDRAEEALDWLGGQQRVDVFITDQQMIGMSGSDILRTVRHRSPGTCRVMLTSCPDTDTLLARAARTI